MDASRRLRPLYTSLLCEGGPSRVYGCVKASLILNILVLVYGRGQSRRQTTVSKRLEQVF